MLQWLFTKIASNAEIDDIHEFACRILQSLTKSSYKYLQTIALLQW